MRRKNTILVVDGDPLTGKILARGLDAACFRVKECLTGKEAAGLNQFMKPALILLELHLPDMHGHDVLTALRPWSHVPVIIITMPPIGPEVLAAFSLGADDCITRPFDVKEVEARILAKLRRHEYWLKCQSRQSAAPKYPATAGGVTAPHAGAAAG